jgi:hypothetical protein
LAQLPLQFRSAHNLRSDNPEDDSDSTNSTKGAARNDRDKGDDEDEDEDEAIAAASSLFVFLLRFPHFGRFFHCKDWTSWLRGRGQKKKRKKERKKVALVLFLSLLFASFPSLSLTLERLHFSGSFSLALV